MLPTFCTLAETATPKGLDGISMVPALTAERIQAAHEFLYWEFYERGGKRAVRFGPWKAVQGNLNSVDQTAGVELYDLRVDLGEQHDIAAEHPAEVERALHYFAEAHTPSAFWSFGGKKK
jgi:arylsulfatase A-like enzyme